MISFSNIDFNKKCKMLPEIFGIDKFNGNIIQYKGELYKIYQEEYINNLPLFNGKKVFQRINPRDENYEHGFIHMTEKEKQNSNSINDRIFDLRRSERLRWAKVIIQNFPCRNVCSNCHKILYYEHIYNKYKRINLLLLEEQYKVILEERSNCYLLISAYYMDEYTMKKEISRINKFNLTKLPL